MALNDAGLVAGSAQLANGAMHAFLYQGGVMIDLNSMIDPQSGWILTQAYAINASGEIAGAGWFDGVEHAFLLDPSSEAAPAGTVGIYSEGPTVTPEPATFGLVMMCLAFLTGAAAIRIRLRARPPRLRAVRPPELS